MTDKLAVIEQGQALAAPSPEEELALAGRIATALDKVIRDKKLFKKIGNKDHVFVEGWTAVAAMRGITPREVSNEAQEDGRYIAVVELVNAQGRVVGNASAECGGPEEELWQNRKPSARRSMAATRATSKACRLCFSWILVLSGYSGTPAEEMEQVESTAKRAPKPAQAAPKAQERPSTPQGDTNYPEWDGTREVQSGKNKGKMWSELPQNFLDFMLSDKVDPGPGKEMASQELGRRAMVEAQGDVVDAEVVREPGEDDEKPLQDDFFGIPPSDDPRFR